MSIQYVSQDEIEAHEAAMQRGVEEKRGKLKAIRRRKKAAIKAAQRAFDRAVKAAEEKADHDVVAIEAASESQLAAMQRDFERLPLLRQVYHEAPDYVFELIVSGCYDLGECRWGKGGLNAFRMANKKCKQVVESCTTMLTNRLEEDGPDSLPIPIIQRCRRVDKIRCDSHNLRSLEGCPDGLKRLSIGNAPHLSDLSPLASCSMMEVLLIYDSSITDVSVVSLMPLLKKFACLKRDEERPSIKDLLPLSSCPMLKHVYLFGNCELKDLSPLTACSALEEVDITLCPLITSLAPLSSLKMLKELWCIEIDPQTTLLPLVLCTGLHKLQCDGDAVDLEDLRRRRPDISVDLSEGGEEDEDE